MLVSLPEGKPSFSHGFPMVFLWFSGFPMVFLWVFLWLSRGYYPSIPRPEWPARSLGSDSRWARRSEPWDRFGKVWGHGADNLGILIVYSCSDSYVSWVYIFTYIYIYIYIWFIFIFWFLSELSIYLILMWVYDIMTCNVYSIISYTWWYFMIMTYHSNFSMDQDQLPEASAAMSWGYHAELWVDDSFHRF